MEKDVILRILLAMTNNKEFFAQSFITNGKLIVTFPQGQTY